jgi:hypothetical protein
MANTIKKEFAHPIAEGSSLILQPALNGGWVVKESYRDHHHNVEREVIGAFSSQADMVEALSSMTFEAPQVVKGGR